MDLKDFKKEFNSVDISIRIKDKTCVDNLIVGLVRQGYSVYLDETEYRELSVVFTAPTEDIYYSSLG